MVSRSQSRWTTTLVGIFLFVCLFVFDFCDLPFRYKDWHTMEQPSQLKYPRTVNVDFRKLDKYSLLKILQHYGVEHNSLTREPSQHDLAVMVARMFEATEVLEDEVVSKFAEKYCYAGSDQGVPSNNALNKKRVVSNNRDILDKDPAVPGEQVAAKANRGEDDGQWILANVIDFDPRNMCYVVQDEDDPNRVLTLPVHEVKRLEDRSSHLRRHDFVLAVFPETTSFYRAVVAKSPKPPVHSNAMWDVVVKFENDEDETGKNPARRVPARFVLRRCDVGEGEESDDEDS